MPGDPALPVRVDDETEARLAVVEAIERGRAEVRTGRVAPHSEVAREARGIIEAAREGR
jgi:predicted transcriptional regulator